MGSKVWNYILGYVIINITGRSLERLVNQCVAEGIRIWNIKRTKPNALSAYLMCEDFYKLKPILKKNRCKVHILSEPLFCTPITVLGLLCFLALYSLWRHCSRPHVLSGR